MSREIAVDDVSARIRELCGDAADLPHGPTQVALLEEAVRLADTLEDDEQSYYCRNELVEAATFAGRNDLVLAHYPWLLAKHDANPERYDEYQLLWRYKWACARLYSTPDIPLAKINAVFKDMQRRFEAYGAGRRAVLGGQAGLAEHRGLFDREAELIREMQATPRDLLSNCAACEAHQFVDFEIKRGKYAKAMQLAKPLLEGRMSCSTKPQETLCSALVPFFRLKRDAELPALYARAVRGMKSLGDRTGCYGSCLLFLALSDNLKTGLKLLGRSLNEGLTAFDPSDRFHYLNAAAFLLHRAELGGSKNNFRLAAPHPLAPAANITKLAAWMDAERRGLAARFDKRNKTRHFSETIRKTDRMARLVRAIPLGDSP